jgi:curved DNA-binding protein CbpA
MSKRPMLASAEKLKTEIKAWQDGDPKNHYEVLGVANDADTSTIRSAFFQLARTWHPDRLPKELSEYKSIVNKAFAAMGEAHQTLSDDIKRRAYDEALDGTPDDEQAQVAAILDASSAYQRAEAMMKTKDFKGALEQAKLAYEGDPTQADYAAIYGWLQGMGRTKGFDDLIELLDSALKDDENNVNALWYRGQLLKKAGHHLRAIKDFKKIVGIKPRHMEAQRELRVHAMRKRSNKEATNTSGLFGRFKKKD